MFDKNNISGLSHTTKEELSYAVDKLKKNNNLSNLTEHFLKAEKDYDINAVILLSIACLESNYGLSKLAVEKNNLFGIDARDSLQGKPNFGKDFKTKEESIYHAGHRLGCQYLKRDSKADWRYCDGKKDIYSVGEKWCSKRDWGDKVINIATRLEKAIEDYREIETVDYKQLYYKQLGDYNSLKDKYEKLKKEVSDAVNRY